VIDMQGEGAMHANSIIADQEIETPVAAPASDCLIDIRVMELLASKLCHDLVSPVSAINNGVELIEDIGGDVIDEAMKLIGDSAVHASRRLKLFRMAYGRAGGEDTISVNDIRPIATQYLTGGKIILNWAETDPAPSLASVKGYMKVILNAVILAEEILAYGGTIAVRTATFGTETGYRFEIAGRNAQMTAIMQASLDGTVEVHDLTPRSIQGYITGKFASQFGFKVISEQPAPDRLDVSVVRG
jgi:histidine phosphotransferase ChpT